MFATIRDHLNEIDAAGKAMAEEQLPVYQAKQQALREKFQSLLSQPPEEEKKQDKQAKEKSDLKKAHDSQIAQLEEEKRVIIAERNELDATVKRTRKEIEDAKAKIEAAKRASEAQTQSMLKQKEEVAAQQEKNKKL